jgi:chromosomal replication initiation ATPase DnaA
MFGSSLASARCQYAHFMQADCQTTIWQKFRDGMDSDHRVLGDDGFIALLKPDMTPPSSQQTLEELVMIICQKYDVSKSALISTSRNRRFAAIRAEIGLTAIESGIATNAQIARYFNRAQSGLSQAIRQLRQQCK